MSFDGRETRRGRRAETRAREVRHARSPDPRRVVVASCRTRSSRGARAIARHDRGARNASRRTRANGGHQRASRRECRGRHRRRRRDSPLARAVGVWSARAITRSPEVCVALGRAKVQIWKNRASAQAVFASARFSRHRSRAPAATQPLRAPRSAHVGRHGPQRQSGTHPTARDVRHPRSHTPARLGPRVASTPSRTASSPFHARLRRFSPRLGSLTPNPPPIPSSRAQDEEEDPTEKFNLELETKQLGELHESRNELLSRVSNLKKDLRIGATSSTTR